MSHCMKLTRSTPAPSRSRLLRSSLIGRPSVQSKRLTILLTSVKQPAIGSRIDGGMDSIILAERTISSTRREPKRLRLTCRRLEANCEDADVDVDAGAP